MEIIEQFIQGKRPDQSLCEDRIIITDAFVSVVDGATPKGDWKPEGKSPAVKIGELIEDVLTQLDDEASAKDFFETINASIQDYYKEHGVYETMAEKPWERMIAGLAVFSKARKEVWQLADVAFRYEDQVFYNKIDIEDITSEARALYLESSIAGGISVDDILAMESDPSRAAIKPIIKNQTCLINAEKHTPYRYGALNGFEVPKDFIHIYDTDGLNEVILATDGYPIVADTLDKSERVLQNLLESDPLCFRENKQTKGRAKGDHSYDDRAYIRFKPE